MQGLCEWVRFKHLLVCNTKELHYISPKKYSISRKKTWEPSSFNQNSVYIFHRIPWMQPHWGVLMSVSLHLWGGEEAFSLRGCGLSHSAWLDRRSDGCCHEDTLPVSCSVEHLSLEIKCVKLPERPQKMIFELKMWNIFVIGQPIEYSVIYIMKSFTSLVMKKYNTDTSNDTGLYNQLPHPKESEASCTSLLQ